MWDMPLTVLAGVFNMGLGVFHLYFPKLLHWDRTLSRMDIMNRGVFLALHWLMIMIFMMVGGALLLGAGGPESSRVLLCGGAAFWAVRAMMQPLLWPFQSRFAYILFVTFILGSGLHAGAWLVE